MYKCGKVCGPVNILHVAGKIVIRCICLLIMLFLTALSVALSVALSIALSNSVSNDRMVVKGELEGRDTKQ
jgi:hypothetical protein